MKESFDSRELTGKFEVICKYDDGNERVWSDEKGTVVRRIIQIVNEYAADGYTLTLRQLHYQFVTNNWIVNHDTAYKKLGSILDDCRYAGVIDWDAIEDRGRVPKIPFSADDLADALITLKRQYRLDRQQGQGCYVELWSEKDALSGILGRSTSKYHIHLVINKGYTSSSAIYSAYQRIVKCITSGIKVKILYFGDHDPSGLDMIRDIRERLFFFLTRGDKLNDEKWHQTVLEWSEEREINDAWWYVTNGYCSEDVLHIFKDKVNKETAKYKNKRWVFYAARIRAWLVENDWFEVIPIGLTMEQIEQYNLPHNPAKVTDPRAGEYVKKFGRQSWEVDALKAHVLTSIVESHVEEHIDMKLVNAIVATESQDLDRMDKYIKKEGGEVKTDDRVQQNNFEGAGDAEDLEE